jgi:hypothetical protein
VTEPEGTPQPETPEPSPQATPGVMLHVTIQNRPNGQAPWVGLQFSTPYDSYVVAFPPDQAEMIARDLPEGLRNAIQECRQQASGLILPNNGKEGIHRV